MKAAEENREFIIEGMLKSLKTLSLLADGQDPTVIGSDMATPSEGELVSSFATFEVCNCTTAENFAACVDELKSNLEFGNSEI